MPSPEYDTITVATNNFYARQYALPYQHQSHIILENTVYSHNENDCTITRSKSYRKLWTDFKDRFHTSFCHEGLRLSIRNPRSDKSGKEFCGMNGFVTVGTCNFIQSLQGPVLEFARSNHVNLNLFIIEFRE